MLLQVTATFTGEPRPVVTWYRNDEVITESRHFHIEERQYDTVSTLNIAKTEITHSGTYRVKVKNDSGEATAELTIKVATKAGPPNNLRVTEVTNTSATLSWESPTETGGTSIRHYIIEKRVTGRQTWLRVTTTTETTVQILELNESTAYEFIVKAETDEGEGEPAEIGILTLKCKEKPPTDRRASKPVEPETRPTIRFAKSDIQVGTNQVVQVDVIFTGTPRPKLTWTFNGRPLTDSRRLRVEERRTEMIATLSIKKTELSDSGVYSVSAVNSVAEAVAEMTLKVLTKAGPPRNLAITDVTPSSAELLWEPPLNDGGSPIKHYTVEKRSAGRTTWMKVATVQETQCVVKDLAQGSKVDFRVRAETDQGEGEAAEVGPVVADYTFGE